jgi:hypothetical protein
MKCLFSHKSFGSLGLGMLIAAFAAAPAQASVNTSQCSEPVLTQPFLSAGDSNWYALPSGESHDNFAGTGWTLSGGAKIVASKLSDGATGQVLDLPSGSKAVSPVICITTEYPNARAIIRDVKGADGVSFYVGYEGTSTWTNPKNTGQIHGNNTEWTLATPVNLQPEKTTGWQPMRITLIPCGKTSEFQLYNLYADPRMRR